MNININITTGTKRLQQEMGIAVVKFFGAFTRLIQETTIDMDNLSISSFGNTSSSSLSPTFSINSNLNSNLNSLKLATTTTTQKLDRNDKNGKIEKNSKFGKNEETEKFDITAKFEKIERIGRGAETLQEREDEKKMLKDDSQLSSLLPAGLAVTQLMKSLPTVYGKNDRGQMFIILSEIGELLSRLTVQKIGAYTAIHDWKIIDALRNNLPSNLSGLKELGIKNSIYKNGLGSLPSSFFQLCANLCQMEIFKIVAISEGFLRRALEKIFLLAPYLEKNNELINWKKMLSRGEIVPRSVMREDVSACLQFVRACSGYQAQQCGSSNDLILHYDYNLLNILRNLIGSESPRSDELIISACECLAEITKDNIRLYQEFIDFELLELILSQFEILNDNEYNPINIQKEIGMWKDYLPDRLISACLDVLNNIVTGVWGDRLFLVINCVREPLARISRVRPHFATKVTFFFTYCTHLHLLHFSLHSLVFFVLVKHLICFFSQINVFKGTTQFEIFFYMHYIKYHVFAVSCNTNSIYSSTKQIQQYLFLTQLIFFSVLPFFYQT